MADPSNNNAYPLKIKPLNAMTDAEQYYLTEILKRKP